MEKDPKSPKLKPFQNNTDWLILMTSLMNGKKVETFTTFKIQHMKDLSITPPFRDPNICLGPLDLKFW